MCIVSNVGDAWRDRLPREYPNISPAGISPFATKSEVEALRRELAELRELLKAAKKFDEATGQPACELAEKVEFSKRIADLMGVDMSEAFG